MGQKVDHLIRRLKGELKLDIPAGSQFRRLRHRRCPTANGAWSWCIERRTEDGLAMSDIGSRLTVTELVRAKTLVAYMDHRSPMGGIDIYPGRRRG